ncbi:hypothetical protein LGR54_01745 [Ancylobacter sp. Lp-2]|uniref:helix-turn-helix transcriptional regulator n=1 Tax=Ancylobacter sp. Lp-2 TaxID=2881339 RepID=UPI001E537E44|nr:hypothetical protein [Ancylobacter sp. Lp-2]MCB4767315.1 hypothetical protein [Ancylobacter sp. Lp-2]
MATYPSSLEPLTFGRHGLAPSAPQCSVQQTGTVSNFVDLTPAELDEGWVRLRDIVKPNGIWPISRSTFYAWVKAGRVRPGVRLGPSVTCWPRAYIRQLMTNVELDGGANG